MLECLEACSVHKWLFGPYGLSLVYASEEWSEDPNTEPIVQVGLLESLIEPFFMMSRKGALAP